MSRRPTRARTATGGRRSLRHRLVAVVAAALIGGGCAARLPARPAGEPQADPAAAEAFLSATTACAGLSTLTAEIGLSGRAGGQRVRGRLIAGFSTPASLRLEAVAPFGPPVFILAGRDNTATLFFPRDHRVLADAGVADVLARLTGLDVDAAGLRRLLAGCLASSDARPADGRQWPGGWRAVALGDDEVAYLRDIDGRVRLVAADYGPWQVDYGDHAGDWARHVRVRGKGVDITAELRQLEVNVPLPDAAFDVDVPPGTAPMSLDELRPVAPPEP